MTVCSFAVVFTVVFTGIALVYADDAGGDKGDKPVRVDPDQETEPEPDPEVVWSDDEELNSQDITYDGEHYAVTLPSHLDKGITIQPNDGGDPVVLTKINDPRDENHKNGGYKNIALAWEDGGFSLWELIEDDSEPTRFDYAITMGPMYSIASSSDGGFTVTNKDGFEVIAVGSPWAVDAKGTEVPAYYEITDEKVLTLVVEHTGGDSKVEYEYPILADPCFAFWRGSCGRKIGASAATGLLGARLITVIGISITALSGGTAAPVTVTAIVTSSIAGITWGVTTCMFSCNP
jgi:hypothetical protein